MKRVLSISALGAVLVACGGGGGGGGPSFANPDSVNFTYGSYGTPTDTTLNAATAGEGGASDALALTEAADDTHTESLVNLPDTMAGAALGDTMTGTVQGAAASARQAMSRRAAAYAAGDLVTATSGFIDPACVAITAISVTYNHCTLTETATDGSTMTLSVDGSLTRGLTSVDWNATVAMAMTVPDPNGNITVRISSHLTGHIGVSEVSADLWNVAGFARSENAASVSGRGQSVSMAFTHNVDIDLDVLPGYSCVANGTIELKRVWSQRPSGTATDLPNVGVMFQWSGGSAPSTCASSMQVSWGVLQ